MNNLVLLAKQAVEKYIEAENIIEPLEDFPKKFLERKAGTFVSIFRSTRGTNAEQKRGTDAEKELRGCIGTYLPTKKNIAEEIIHNAIAAATEDYRFGPIKKEELPYLSYTVYILSKLELVKDISELNPKKFGIIVKSQGFAAGRDVIFNTAPKSYEKTGLLLPDLKGINTAEEQISIACQKGGINPTTEKILIYRFTVEKYQ